MARKPSRDDAVRVWDPLVRICHWSLVAAFFTAYLSGDDLEDLHTGAGYVALGLVVLRVLWGVVGTRHARFTDFVRGPDAVARYLASLLTSRPIHYLGHNPAGGWMVLALLAANLALGWSGLELMAAEGKGPLAGDGVSLVAGAHASGDEDREDRRRRPGREDREDFWKDLHEVLANLTLALVLVHVAGVVISSVLHRENLVRAMITGRKPRPPPEDG